MLRKILPLLALGLAGHAHAETINCTPITSLPTTISTAGVYCLKQDLATNIAAGNAINIGVNNVTLDCNGFKLGGLAAGDTTRTYGVQASDKLNTVVRNCNVRGFFAGIWMQGGAGHVIEGNRLEGNTFAAIGLFGSDGDLVRNNYVTDTGGSLPIDTLPFGNSYGIAAQSTTGITVIDNTVVNTHATAGSGGNAYGLGFFTVVGQIEDNRVTQTMSDGSANAYGIYLGASTTIVRSNTALNAATVTGFGITAQGGSSASFRDNVVKRFSTGMSGGVDAGGNFAD